MQSPKCHTAQRNGCKSVYEASTNNYYSGLSIGHAKYGAFVSISFPLFQTRHVTIHMMKFKPKIRLNHNKNVRYCKFFDLSRRSTFIGMIQGTFTLWRQRFSNVRPKIYSGIVATKSLFLDVMWPGSDQLKGMVLGEKIHYKKKKNRLLSHCIFELLDCTRHIWYFTLVWFDQTPGGKPA